MDEYQQALADVAAWDGKSVIHLAQLIRNVEEKFWTVSEDWADDDHTITSALMYEVHCELEQIKERWFVHRLTEFAVFNPSDLIVVDERGGTLYHASSVFVEVGETANRRPVTLH